MGYSQKCLSRIYAGGLTISFVETASSTGGIMAAMATNYQRTLPCIRKTLTICTEEELYALGVEEKKFKGWCSYQTAEQMARKWYKETETDIVVSVCGELTANKKKSDDNAAVCCILVRGRKAHCYTLKNSYLAGLKRREMKEQTAGEFFKKLWILLKEQS